MENKEFLSEETYQKSNKKVKKVGKVLIIIGLTLLALGFVFLILGFFGFGSQISKGTELGQDSINPSRMFSSFGGLALGGLMIAPGIFITIVGFVVRFVIGNKREIVSYTTQQVMPIAQEGIEKMAPTIEDAAGTIAQSISKGIKEGMKDNDKE